MLNIFKFRNGLNIIPRPDGATAPTAQGDLAVSSADGNIYYNNGSAIYSLLITTVPGSISDLNIIVSGPGASTFQDGTDPTKQIAFNVATASTGTVLTIQDNQTTSQILNVPNITATDTLVTQAFAQTLTNKTINGSLNTLTNIPLSTAVTGILPLANGGTGLNSASTAALFNSLTPMTTTGDLEYESATNVASRLAIGTTGQVLTVSGGLPVWMAPTAGFVNPMTSVGDMIVGGASGTATRLAATTNGYVLTLVSGSPAWAPNSGGTAPTSIGALDGQSPNAMGLTIASNVLYAQSASATAPGMVNTGTQTFAGNKIFNSQITLPEIATPSNPPTGYNDLYFKPPTSSLISESTTAPGGVSYTGTTTFYGQQFTSQISGSINNVVLKLEYASGSGLSGNMHVDLYTDSAGNPGTLIETGVSQNANILTTSYQLITFTFSGLNNVVSGTTYHLVFNTSAVTFGSSSMVIASGSIQVGDGAGYTELTSNSGSTWTPQVGSALYFVVNSVSVSNAGILFTLSSLGVETPIGIQPNPIQLTEISTPSNPPSGSNDLYFKSDGNLYILNSLGQETLVGNTGGAGSNLYASSQVTTDSTTITATSFTTFSNSPAFTFTPTVSGNYKVYASIPIDLQSVSNDFNSRIFNTSGNATLLYESQITNQGGTGNTFGVTNGLAQSVYALTAGVSYVFDIQGMARGGGGALCNGSITDGAPFYMFAELSSNGNFGPGMSGTEWKNDLTFNLSASFGTTSGVEFLYRRVGDSMEVRGVFSSVSPTAAPAAIGLPTGYQINAAKMFGNPPGTSVGEFYNPQQAGATLGYGSGVWVVFYDGSDTSNLYLSQNGSGDAFVKQNANTFTGSNQWCVFEFSIPILGWGVNNGSNTIPAVSAVYTATTSVTFSNTAPLNFATKVVDTANAVTTGASWKFTAPFTGNYTVSLSSSFGGSGFTACVYKNGSIFQALVSSTSASNVFSGTVIVPMSATDYIDIRSDGGTLQSTSTTLGNTYNSINISLNN